MCICQFREPLWTNRGRFNFLVISFVYILFALRNFQIQLFVGCGHSCFIGRHTVFAGQVEGGRCVHGLTEGARRSARPCANLIRTTRAQQSHQAQFTDQGLLLGHFVVG